MPIPNAEVAVITCNVLSSALNEQIISSLFPGVCTLVNTSTRRN